MGNQAGALYRGRLNKRKPRLGEGPDGARQWGNDMKRLNGLLLGYSTPTPTPLIHEGRGQAPEPHQTGKWITG
jgi:hypothetical protein